MKFKTVKEFLNWLWGGDTSIVIGNDNCICFEVSKNTIAVYSYNSEEIWEDGCNSIDIIYGFFCEGGGHLDLFCENYWSVDFTIEEPLSVGSIYKIKLDLEPVEKTPTTQFIEL